MPIKPELRYYYPIDLPQVSRWVRFVRAQGRCETCGRPHGQVVRHLGDGRWWDEARQSWRDGRGREIPCPAAAEEQPRRTTKVVLAAAGQGISRPLPSRQVWRPSSHQRPSPRWRTTWPCGRPQASQQPFARTNRTHWLTCGQSIG